jgi:hypothetical protein
MVCIKLSVLRPGTNRILRGARDFVYIRFEVRVNGLPLNCSACYYSSVCRN